MDPHTAFCPNPACPATGHIGQGNINIHSRSPERYRCNVCRKTFGARKGTPLKAPLCIGEALPKQPSSWC